MATSPARRDDPQRDLLMRIAHSATSGVAHHIQRGEPLIAGPLQGLASTAWAATDDLADAASVRVQAERALHALDRVHGAGPARRFVVGVVERLDALALPPPPRLDDLADLRELLQAAGGHTSLRAGVLRDAYGAARLDTGVRIGIHLVLRDLGVGHLPEEIPNRARDWMRLYLLDHPVGMLADGVRTIGPDGDRLMRLAARMLAADDR